MRNRKGRQIIRPRVLGAVHEGHHPLRARHKRADAGGEFVCLAHIEALGRSLPVQRTEDDLSILANI
ncbi:hypothetical protein SDC9_178199 [bioreactor metagenome]|uniref:Uncharacterized protein n=1 Tax=bioreactor metagenome TaxID=1076179 RepID=A0A645GV97_9ZZZZ